MSFTFVASTNNVTTSSTVTGNKPTGTVDNDIIFADIFTKDSTLPSGIPSGWTLLESVINGSQHAVYWKVASSEGSSWSWTGGGGSFNTSITILTWRGGFNISDPIDISASNQDGNSTTMSVSLGSVGAINSAIIYFSSVTANTTNTKDATPISGWTDDYNAVASSLRLLVSSLVWSSSGSFGNITSTLGSSQLGVLKGNIAVALKPEVATNSSNFFMFM